MIHEYEQKDVVTSGDIRTLLGYIIKLDLHDIVDSFFGNYWGISRCLVLSILFWGFFFTLWGMVPSLPLFAFGWALGTAPIWMPVAAVIFASYGRLKVNTPSPNSW